MLFRSEQYRITTLCRPDPGLIEKTKEQLKNTIRKILYENPEFIGHVLIGYMGHGTPRDIELGEQKIQVCRLNWKLKGEKDVLDRFLTVWKEADENPLYYYRVEPCYSLLDVEKMMDIE